VFIDDVTFMGGTSTYNEEEVAPDIRKFVYEYATVVDRILVRFITAGITASGWKTILATPRLGVVGTIVSRDGWHLAHGLVTKILNWPEPRNLTEVRGFLGTAGVGRKWIRNFSLIAKPLTLLTRISKKDFYFDDAAREAMEKMKGLVSTAPVLVRIDYEIAKLITPLPRSNDEGLVIVAVDSCSNGAGWVVYQHVKDEKHPAFFGSCTFSEVESRYSQPKCELYGVFRAIKDLRHRIWGIHFRLDVDAKFLVEMMKSPDLPNAPMTRWVMYLSLFDFEVKHVAADKHLAPDGLSRRRRSAEDSEDEDANIYLEKFMGNTTVNPSFRTPPFKPSEVLTIAIRETFDSMVASRRPRPRVTFGDWVTPSILANINVPRFDDQDFLHDDNTKRIHRYDSRGFDPSYAISTQNKGGLISSSLLRSTDTLTYTGHEFENRKTPTCEIVGISLGEEEFTMEITTYGYEYMTGPIKGESLLMEPLSETCPGGSSLCVRYGTREDYENVDPAGVIACISHTYGVKDLEPPELWREMKAYLKDGMLPSRCENQKERKLFLSRTRNFMVHDDRLWKIGSGGQCPRLVITDQEKRTLLLAQVHNEVGHRGRDGTYKLLAERYYWPNLYDDVAYFVRSCNDCQMRSRMRPKIPFSPTWNSAILRCFHLDTVYMPKGRGGKRFLLQAVEPAMGWPEARASRKNDSYTWANFIYEELICRFGCIPYCVVDGGPEFRGAAKILFDRYGITVIISSPYHPQGNSTVERAHQVIVNALLRAAGSRPKDWPIFLFAILLAIRCTVSRMTGFTPYFLLYGRNPLLVFDIADHMWETLDWDKVINTEDLITT
jgi:hypothetical protein